MHTGHAKRCEVDGTEDGANLPKPLSVQRPKSFVESSVHVGQLLRGLGVHPQDTGDSSAGMVCRLSLKSGREALRGRRGGRGMLRIACATVPAAADSGGARGTDAQIARLRKMARRCVLRGTVVRGVLRGCGGRCGGCGRARAAYDVDGVIVEGDSGMRHARAPQLGPKAQRLRNCTHPAHAARQRGVAQCSASPSPRGGRTPPLCAPAVESVPRLRRRGSADPARPLSLRPPHSARPAQCERVLCISSPCISSHDNCQDSIVG